MSDTPRTDAIESAALAKSPAAPYPKENKP